MRGRTGKTDVGQILKDLLDPVWAVSSNLFFISKSHHDNTYCSK